MHFQEVILLYHLLKRHVPSASKKKRFDKFKRPDRDIIKPEAGTSNVNEQTVLLKWNGAAELQEHRNALLIRWRCHLFIEN